MEKEGGILLHCKFPKYSSYCNINIMHSFARAEPAIHGFTHSRVLLVREVSTETKIGSSGYQERHFRPDLTEGERCCSADPHKHLPWFKSCLSSEHPRMCICWTAQVQAEKCLVLPPQVHLRSWNLGLLSADSTACIQISISSCGWIFKFHCLHWWLEAHAE